MILGLNATQWWWICLGLMLVSMIIQGLLNSQFNKYSTVTASDNEPAYLVARRLLDQNGCHDVEVRRVQGRLTDHFDPRTNTVSLSDSVFGSSSLSAVSVAAHECGHAIQYQQDYAPMRVRSAMAPAVQIGSNLAIPLFLIGLILGIGSLAYIGLLFYALAFAFQVVTLPVEINASHRALDALRYGGFLNQDEIPAARKVLTAAAFTYIIGALMSVAQLFRMASLVDRRRR